MARFEAPPALSRGWSTSTSQYVLPDGIWQSSLRRVEGSLLRSSTSQVWG
jgi:hypothetical protein